MIPAYLKAPPAIRQSYLETLLGLHHQFMIRIFPKAQIIHHKAMIIWKLQEAPLMILRWSKKAPQTHREAAILRES